MTGEAERSGSLGNDTSFSNFAVLADLGGVEAEQAAHTGAVARAALELGIPLIPVILMSGKSKRGEKNGDSPLRPRTRAPLWNRGDRYWCRSG